MKTIAIDLSPAEVSPAGIGQYTINLTKKLLELDKKNNYLIYTTLPFERLSFDNKRVQNIVIPFPPSFRARGIRWMMAVNKDLKKRGATTLISYSNHFFSLIFPNTIQFIHDLAPVKYPQYFPIKARMVLPFTTRMAMQQSKKIVTVTETVKAELLHFLKVPGEKISVVPNARNEMAYATNDAVLGQHVPLLPEKYILSVSTLEPRKNYKSAIKAFAKLKKEKRVPADLKYVIIGKQGWYYKEIYKLVKDLEMTEDIIFTGYTPDEYLPDIYKKAKAFIYLSHYEGFGMPPLEALSYNLPTLLSDIPVFKESFSEWADFVAPEAVPLIADKIEALLKKKPAKTAEAVLKKFNWTESAKRLYSIIEEIS